MSLAVGNDVVDLDEASAPGAALLDRVLAREERDFVERAEEPRQAYWQLWAAKEAGYKAFARQEPELLFAHQKFQVDPGEGRVRHGARILQVQWAWDGGALSCAGTEGPELQRLICSTRSVAALLKLPIHLTAAELESVYSANSRASRMLGKQVCSERLGVESRRLEIIRPSLFKATGRARRGAPEVWLDGERLAAIQISLSHHGRFASCALLTSDACSGAQ